MRDIIFISVVSLSGCGYLLVAFWGEYARRELSRLHDLNHWTTEFFKAADTVLAAPHVPAEMTASIAFINRMLTHPGAAKSMALALARTDDRVTRQTKLDDELERCDDKLAFAFGTAIVNGMLAISYTDPRYGTVGRAALASIQAEARASSGPIMSSVDRFVENKVRKGFFSHGFGHAGVAKAA